MWMLLRNFVTLSKLYEMRFVRFAKTEIVELWVSVLNLMK